MNQQIHTIPNYQQSIRFDYLDSMRGIAALMVLIGHYINWKFDSRLIIKLFSLVINANDAVSFFFVLSGLVLGYVYINSDRPLYLKSFYVARIYRLFPGFIIALLLNVLYHSRYQFNVPGLYDVFIKNKSHFWDELLLFRGNNNFFLPGWTLTIELAMSFLMPFFILIVKQNRKLAIPFAIASFLGAHITGIFVFHFALGLHLAAYFKDIQSPTFKDTKLYKYRTVLVIMATIFFMLRKLDAIIHLPKGIHYVFGFLKLDFFIFSAIGAYFFILYTIHFPKVQRFFESKILLFLGRISYGIYIVHWVFVVAFYDYWDKIQLKFGWTNLQQFFIGFILILTISLLGATALYYWVEKPFINIGRKQAKKIKKDIQIL